LGIEIIQTVIQKREFPDPRTYLGKGKFFYAKDISNSLKVDIIITASDLKPSQHAELKKKFKKEVLDRSEVILNIFEKHATSREGKLEVELAKLIYALPRLKGSEKGMSRVAGGIGTRGLGEQKLELDRRKISKNISTLKNELEEINKQRILNRKRREKSDIPLISIVGYTNAGKSSLLKKITNKDVLIENKLFSTLDTKSSELLLPGGRKTIISDTVGFINRLPHELMKSFRSTLEEAKYSDLLIIVVDISDKKNESKLKTVFSTLDDIGAGDNPFILVYNKIDLVSDETIQRLQKKNDGAVFICAKNGFNIDSLFDKINECISKNEQIHEINFDIKNMALFMKMRSYVNIISEKYLDGRVKVKFISSLRVYNELTNAIPEV